MNDKLKQLRKDCEKPDKEQTMMDTQMQLQLVMFIMQGSETKINEICITLTWYAHQKSLNEETAILGDSLKSYLANNQNKRLGRRELWHTVKVLVTDASVLAYQKYLVAMIKADEGRKVQFDAFKFKTMALADRYRRTPQVKFIFR